MIIRNAKSNVIFADINHLYPAYVDVVTYRTLYAAGKYPWIDKRKSRIVVGLFQGNSVAGSCRLASVRYAIGEHSKIIIPRSSKGYPLAAYVGSMNLEASETRNIFVRFLRKNDLKEVERVCSIFETIWKKATKTHPFDELGVNELILPPRPI